ncbi:hypothetical protein [Actinomyces sp. oral taxon 181]|uniref:hypothetical protein n=1 Tax=Actinomyces sp. oral taxon 181 TaxID=712121 RepID=UPI0025BD776E|nr:hypothetical protein [Actinomyces sp. oral taxon 181]MBS5751177.1 hypothetical protein [Actinomyces sp. oral taxon 181]
MPTVPVYRYASGNDYKAQKTIGGSYVSVNCSAADLVRYSLDNGHFEGHVVTSEWGQRFYHSIPRFALALDAARKHFSMTTDYCHAEASYKGAVSFYLGMIGARLVFDKFLGGDKPNYQLLHAGDSKHFILTPSSGAGKQSRGKRPDYIAIDDQGVPYALVEAKGTSGVRLAYERVNHAKTQLNLDSVTTLTGTGHALYTRQGAELEKHVVASSFTSGVAPKGSSWELCDVDPEGAGGGQLTIQLDRAIYAHYSPMVQWLSSDHSPDPCRGEMREERINNVDCELIEISKGVSVGLVKGLREAIGDQGNVDDCFHRLSEFFHSKKGFRGLSESEKVSMGGDGVVVVLSDEYVRSFKLEVDRAL